ncbi:hypothetical protein CHUAL_012553 [Chamberlinius hualienensis]
MAVVPVMRNQIGSHLINPSTQQLQFWSQALNGKIKFWSNVTYTQCRSRFSQPKLSPQQVNTILRCNESHVDLSPSGSIKCFDVNQLPSNNPTEDRRAEARCVHTTGMLFGVFDGHGGWPCAEMICRRLFNYIAASLLPLDILEQVANRKDGDPLQLVQWYNKPYAGNFSRELGHLSDTSFNRYLGQLLKNTKPNSEFNMQDNLVKVFQQLDRDFWDEVEAAELSSSTSLLNEMLTIAMSGAVACVAHLDGVHLHIANTGDCRAVLGTLSESNTWVAKPLTKLHGFENPEEVRRLLGEHPANESSTIIKQERLFGQLSPLRAFGDFRFKWPVSMQKRLLVPLYGHNILPPNYYTPPYLTAKPEVTHHRLLPRDKFLVLATDGLWEQVPPSRVVQMVGEYMSGRQTLEPFRLPPAGKRHKGLVLGEINEILKQRQEGLHHKPIDANAATHLLRNALGGTEYGIDHTMLSQMLSVPEDVVRLVRDDITIVIVFFDKDYLRHRN